MTCHTVITDEITMAAIEIIAALKKKKRKK